MRKKILNPARMVSNLHKLTAAAKQKQDDTGEPAPALLSGVYPLLYYLPTTMYYCFPTPKPLLGTDC